MHAMAGWAPATPLQAQGAPTPAQRKALEHLVRQVEGFLLTSTSAIPSTDWGRKIAAPRMTCTGEVVAKAAPLTWRQIEPALPPQRLTGKLDPVAVAEPPLADLLQHPRLSLTPEAEWPQHLPNAKVVCSPTQNGS